MDPGSLAELQDLLEGPALQPPQGVIPDFENPGGSHTLGYATVVVTSVFSLLSVVIRLTNKAMMRSFGIGEFLMVSALGLLGGLEYILYDKAIFPGAAVHQWNVKLKYLPDILFAIHIFTVLYSPAIMCLKISVLIDWIRLFVPDGRRNWMFWACHSLIWANIVFYISGTLIEIFQCTPREKIWNVFYEGGSCHVNILANNFSSGIVNLVSDLAILALPQWTIWNLRMTMPKRVGVSLLFGIGIFVCVASAIRLRWLYAMLTSKDIFYCAYQLALWSAAEMTAGFMVLAIPCLPKVFNSLPYSGSVVSFLRSLSSRNVSSYDQNKPSIRTWGQGKKKNRRGQWDITELDDTRAWAGTVDRPDYGSAMPDCPVSAMSDNLSETRSTKHLTLTTRE